MEILIPVNGLQLPGTLTIPDRAKGLVVFSHGSGSSRLSGRNRFVAQELNKRHLGTLLFDLLTEEEDEVYDSRFDIPLLTRRLLAVTSWAQQDKRTRGLPLGYFGASTGASSALLAAAEPKAGIRAVVSRGGRTDLADERLPDISAATLFIVGGEDHGVIELNQRSFALLTCTKSLEIIAGATHLFEEAGALERVAALAGDWFEQHLPA